jgi:hypothetical protein
MSVPEACANKRALTPLRGRRWSLEDTAEELWDHAPEPHSTCYRAEQPRIIGTMIEYARTMSSSLNFTGHFLGVNHTVNIRNCAPVRTSGNEWSEAQTQIQLNRSHLWEFKCEEGAKCEPMHELPKLGGNHEEAGKFILWDLEPIQTQLYE